MIIIEPNISIRDEDDIKIWTASSSDFFVDAFMNGDVRFVVPYNLLLKMEESKRPTAEKNHLLQAYKVGLLKMFLSAIYPDKKYEDIYRIIRDDFHVFFSMRKLKSCFTLYKKSKKIFFPCS